ncbi:MAG: hypothetical protein RR365_14975 [Bacteroides sp.]
MGLFTFERSATAATAAANLPVSLQLPELYTGTAFPAAPDTCSQLRATQQKVKTNLRGGALTIAFAGALCRAVAIREQGADRDGYGINPDWSVAEWTENGNFKLPTALTPTPIIGNGEIWAIAFNRATGKFYANTGRGKPDLSKNPKESAAPFIFALWPVFMECSEFALTFTDFVAACHVDNTTELQKAACKLADVGYYLTSGKTPTIDVDAPNNATLGLLTNQKSASQDVMPTTGTGTLTLCAVSPLASQAKARRVSYTSDAFNSAFAGERTLSESESLMVPIIDESYILPQEIVSITTHIHATRAKRHPIKNILLRGAPGTGKTEGAKAIAAGLGLPYVFITCNSNSEIYDILGQMMPCETGAAIDSLFTAEETMEALPSIEDIEMDPITAFDDMTCVVSSNCSGDKEILQKLPALEQMEKSPNEAFTVMEHVVRSYFAKINAAAKQSAFHYVESPLIKAIRYGWVCELQEPSLIANPGVLPGLNALMDCTKSVTLPTGETIMRHPDAVIISTTNIDLEGCRAMNQSFIDRHQLIVDMTMPTDDIIEARVRAMTECDDAGVDVVSMIDTMHQIQQAMKRHGITDGTAGIRSLSNWVQSYLVTGSYRESARMTIIPGATADEDGIAEVETLVDQKFSA